MSKEGKARLKQTPQSEGAAGCPETFWTTGLGSLVKCPREPRKNQFRIQKGCKFKDSLIHNISVHGKDPGSGA